MVTFKEVKNEIGDKIDKVNYMLNEIRALFQDNSHEDGVLSKSQEYLACFPHINDDNLSKFFAKDEAKLQDKIRLAEQESSKIPEKIAEFFKKQNEQLAIMLGEPAAMALAAKELPVQEPVKEPENEPQVKEPVMAIDIQERKVEIEESKEPIIKIDTTMEEVKEVKSSKFEVIDREESETNSLMAPTIYAASEVIERAENDNDSVAKSKKINGKKPSKTYEEKVMDRLWPVNKNYNSMLGTEKTEKTLPFETNPKPLNPNHRDWLCMTNLKALTTNQQ